MRQTIAPKPYQALVVHVADGDTIKIVTGQKKQVIIRLAAIDAPERKQPWGNKAKQVLSGLAIQKMVTVDPVATFRNGRTIARIYIGYLNVNKEMVRTGNAWAYRRYIRYMRDKSLLNLEAEAVETKRGLWALPEAERVPPWEWRVQKELLRRDLKLRRDLNDA